MKEKKEERIEYISKRLEEIRDWLFEEVDTPSSSSSRANNGGCKNGKVDEKLPVGTAVMRPDGTFTYVDNSFASIFGYENNRTLINKSWQFISDISAEKEFMNEILPKVTENGGWEGEISGKLFKDSDQPLYLHLDKTSEGKIFCKIKGSTKAREGREEMNNDDNHRKQGKLEALRKGLKEIQKCESKGDIYDKAVRIVSKVLDFDCCALNLRKENTLIAKANRISREDEAITPYGICNNLSSITTKKGEIIRGNDLSRYFEDDLTPDRFSSFISVPIESIGTLQVFSTEREEFSDQDTNLLQILANHLRERLARAELEGDLREQAIHDQLTGLYNRHYLQEVLAKEVQRAQRYNHTLSFLMVDINGFKEVNDYYTHSRGDKVLKEVAEILKSNVRKVDSVIRYGGDEFLVLLPETGQDSQLVAGRLKEEVQAWNEESDLIDIPLSIAIGYSNFDPDEELDIEKKIKEADDRMYEDKKNKNKNEVEN